MSGTPLNRSVLTYFVMLCFRPGSSWKIKPRHTVTLSDDATAWFNKKFGAHPGKSENAIILKVRSYQMHKRINAARLTQTCCSCIVSNSSMRYTAERSSRSTATRRTAMAALSLRTNAENTTSSPTSAPSWAVGEAAATATSEISLHQLANQIAKRIDAAHKN